MSCLRRHAGNFPKFFRNVISSARNSKQGCWALNAEMVAGRCVVAGAKDVFIRNILDFQF